MCTKGINDAGGKFATGDNDTGGTFGAVVNYTGGKFANCINDTGGKFAAGTAGVLGTGGTSERLSTVFVRFRPRLLILAINY
jgi:hypothetical protein